MSTAITASTPMNRRGLFELLHQIADLVRIGDSKAGRVEFVLDQESGGDFNVTAIYQEGDSANLVGVDVNTTRMLAVMEEIVDERFRQDAKWGEQNYKGGNGLASHLGLAGVYKTLNDLPSIQKTWKDVFLGEMHEALGATSDEELRQQLVQLAALAVAWIQAIDRKSNGDRVS